MTVSAKLFRKNGYSLTTISEIVRKTSLSKGTLYYHFTNKQKILYEVVTKGMNSLLPYVREVFSSDMKPDEKLREITKFHVLNLLKNYEFTTLSMRERDMLEEEYRSKYIDLRDQYQSILVDIVNNGIAQRVFPTTNVKLTVFAILEICNGPARWYKPNGALSPEQISEEFSSLICDYLLRKPNEYVGQ